MNTSTQDDTAGPQHETDHETDHGTNQLTDHEADAEPDVDQAAVDAALARVEVIVAADPDLVHGDVVEQVALEVPVDVAVAMCQQSMDFVPDTVRSRLFAVEHADTISAGAIANAEKAAAAQKLAQRATKAAATRAATAAAEALVQTQAIRSNTCPICFTVRAASGTCACE